ncbi:hypothetical protein MWLp12_1680 [Lactiplantibacillus plantarum]|nr:hypothetical protein LBP_cg1553 [Lactiplantibacillus plantarum subsp. plantarum P-8]WCL69068.1 hypothetical protein MWLp12_1680 [Lactiplantibacillus plantarum]
MLVNHSIKAPIEPVQGRLGIRQRFSEQHFSFERLNWHAINQRKPS